jgi:hypothetical protein
MHQDMKRRYIFTVVAGRSGQASLTDIFRRHVPNCYPAFEEPQVHPVLRGRLGNYERRFRRKYIQSNELLGRGKVLAAYEDGNTEYLEKIAAKRIESIHKAMGKAGSSLYVDVSKFFARGLHRGFLEILPEISLIWLVRDPIANMRSCLNRNKDFFLDNSAPESESNLLRLDSTDMEKGELYLWIWCELYLRYEQMVACGKVARHVRIRTERLDDSAYMEETFERLGVEHSAIEKGPRLNTNASQGLGETRATEEDRATFDRFISRLPRDKRRQLTYFDDYEPDQGL